MMPMVDSTPWSPRLATVMVPSVSSRPRSRPERARLTRSAHVSHQGVEVDVGRIVYRGCDEPTAAQRDRDAQMYGRGEHAAIVDPESVELRHDGASAAVSAGPVTRCL